MPKQTEKLEDRGSPDWLAEYKVKLDTAIDGIINQSLAKLDLPDEQDFLAELRTSSANAKPSRTISALHNAGDTLQAHSKEIVARTHEVQTAVDQEINKNQLKLGETWQEDFDQTARCLEAGFNFTKKRIDGVSRRNKEGIKVEKEEKEVLGQLGVKVQEQQSDYAVLGLKGTEEKLGDLVKGGRRIVRGLPETET